MGRADHRVDDKPSSWVYKRRDVSQNGSFDLQYVRTGELRHW